MLNLRVYALIVGLVFILLGGAGFVPGLTPMGAMAPQDQSVSLTKLFGYELHLFPVNILHDLVHIGFGIWGLIAARTLGGARLFFRAVAAIYALLTLMGLVPALASGFGLVPLYGNDVWLHAALALVGVYLGWVHRDPAATL